MFHVFADQLFGFAGEVCFSIPVGEQLSQPSNTPTKTCMSLLYCLGLVGKQSNLMFDQLLLRPHRHVALLTMNLLLLEWSLVATLSQRCENDGASSAAMFNLCVFTSKRVCQEHRLGVLQELERFLFFMSNRLTRTKLSRPKLLSYLNDNAIALLNQKGNHVGEENGLANARCASNDKHADSRLLGFEFVIQPIHDLSTHFCIALAHYQLVFHSLITQNVVGKLRHFISFPLAWLWRLLHCLVHPLAEGVWLLNNLSQSGMWNILLNTETTTEKQSPYLKKKPTNTKKTLDWVKGAKEGLCPRDRCWCEFTLKTLMQL